VIVAGAVAPLLNSTETEPPFAATEIT
jgi:hypothetical protein